LTEKKKKKGKKAPKRFRPNKERLEAIIRRVQLVDITLLDSFSKRTIEHVDLNTLKMQTKTTMVETVEEEPPGKSFMGICRFGIRGVLEEDKEDENEIFKIEGSFLLQYLLKERGDITTEDIASFVVVNGEHHAWPFWRELCHNISSRMGIDPITLPIRQPRYKFSELLIEKAEESIIQPPSPAEKK